jgi:hypothetical protein
MGATKDRVPEVISMSQLIQSKIDVVRRKHAVVRSGFGAATLSIVAISVIAGTMLIDWWLDLPYLVRCAMLAIHLSALAYLLLRHVLWPLVKGPDDETVALWIESFYEDAASRLISAVQFSRPKLALEGMSPQMIGAAVHEAETYVQDKDTAEVVAVDDMFKRLGIALLMLVVFGGVFLYGKHTTRDLFLRALAVPGIDVPRKTQVELLTPAKRIVAKGDTITIEAAARGVIPDEGSIRVSYAGGTTAEFDMRKDLIDDEKFSIEIQNVQDSFNYRVYLNDGRSENATIEAHPRPDVSDIEVVQHLPAYTKRPPAVRSKSDLKLLAGSRLQLRVTANKPVADTVSLAGPRNRVKFEGAKQEYYLKRDASDPRVLVTEDRGAPSIPIPAEATGMSIHLVDELGLESKDPAVYRLEIVPDAPPVVNITFPLVREELVTERARTRIGFDINDDIGIARASINWVKATSTAVKGDGLTAQYFNSPELEGDVVVERIEPGIEFNAGNQSPVKGVRNDNFSIRWTGKLLAPQTGTYRFSFNSDDGVRMWVNDEPVLNEWGDRTGEFNSGPVELKQGEFANVRIEYQEIGGDARTVMTWVTPDKRRAKVPTDVLFSSDSALLAAQRANVKPIELDIGQNQKSVRGQYVWNLAELDLQPGDVIEWWVEARDGNDQTGPGITESEHRSIKIGSEAQVREYLLQRLGNPLESIQEIQEQQVDLTGSLGAIILEKPKPNANEPPPTP